MGLKLLKIVFVASFTEEFLLISQCFAFQGRSSINGHASVNIVEGGGMESFIPEEYMVGQVNKEEFVGEGQLSKSFENLDSKSENQDVNLGSFTMQFEENIVGGVQFNFPQEGITLKNNLTNDIILLKPNNVNVSMQGEGKKITIPISGKIENSSFKKGLYSGECEIVLSF